MSSIRHIASTLCNLYELIPSEHLVMEDLIQHSHILFDDSPSQSPPVPPLHDVSETTSALTYGSLFLSPEIPRSAEVQAKGPTSRHSPGTTGGIPTPTKSSFSSLPLDGAEESRPTVLLSPLLGLPSSQTLTEGVETTTTEEQVTSEATGAETVETSPNSSTPPEVASLGPTSVAEWRLRQSRLSTDPEARTIPQSPPESVLSSASNFRLSSATSLQTAMRQGRDDVTAMPVGADA